MEAKFELKKFIIRYFCEPCARKGGGEYLPTGVVLLSNPPQYPHKCNRCGETKVFNQKYPRYEYEQMDNY